MQTSIMMQPKRRAVTLLYYLPSVGQNLKWDFLMLFSDSIYLFVYSELCKASTKSKIIPIYLYWALVQALSSSFV